MNKQYWFWDSSKIEKKHIEASKMKQMKAKLAHYRDEKGILHHFHCAEKRVVQVVPGHTVLIYIDNRTKLRNIEKLRFTQMKEVT